MTYLFFRNIYLYLRGQRDAYSMAQCYEEGHLVKKDIKAAIKLYHRATRKSDARAFYPLGLLYEKEQNIPKAAQIYYQGALAAGLNSPNVMRLYKLSRTYSDAGYYGGLYFEETYDLEEALWFYQRAVSNGHTQSMYRIGKIYCTRQDRHQSKKEFNQGLYWHKKAALSSCTDSIAALTTLATTESKAARALAQVYKASPPSAQNKAQSIHYYKKAIHLGDKKSSYYLANLYLSESEDNTALACAYYLKALEHKDYLRPLKRLEVLLPKINDPKLEFDLGKFYQEQLREDKLALKWFKRSARHGNINAKALIKNKFASYREPLATKIPIPERNQHAISKKIKPERQMPSQAQKELSSLSVSKKPDLQSNKHKAASKQSFAPVLNINTDYKSGNIVETRTQSIVKKNSTESRKLDKDAALLLGHSYQLGDKSIKQDMTQAYAYYNYSIKKGNKKGSIFAKYFLALPKFNALPSDKTTTNAKKLNKWKKDNNQKLVSTDRLLPKEIGRHSSTSNNSTEPFNGSIPQESHSKSLRRMPKNSNSLLKK